MKYRFITIEGSIGAGKTTLAHLLAERLQAKLILEAFADNPFLPSFYENPARFAFPVELFFMAERYKQLNSLLAAQELFAPTTISDYLFVKCLLYAKVTLSEEEFKLYQRLFDIIHQQLIAPDLIVYLHNPLERLQRNIKERGRPYEANISGDYLMKIQDTYLSYLRQHPVRTLFVDASNADFLHHPDHLNILLDALEKDYSPGQHHLHLP